MRRSPIRRFDALFVLVALTVLFGLQFLRMWLPMMAFLVRDRLGWTSVQIGVLALGVLVSGCLAPVLANRLGLRRAAWLTLGGLALVRLEIQLWQGDTIVDLVSACLGVAAFVFAAPVLLLLARAGSRPQILSAGWVAGLLADLVLHGLYGTWDAGWRSDVGSLVLVLVLVVAVWMALRHVTQALDGAPVSPGGAGSLAFFGIWPLLFLYSWVLGNPARLSALSGSSTQTCWLILAGLLAAALLADCLGWWTRWAKTTAAMSALVLVAMAWRPWADGAWALVGSGVGAVAMAAAIAILLRAAASSETVTSVLPFTTGHGLAMVVFFLLVFVSSSGWDVRLPVGADRMLLVAAMIAGLCLADAARGLPTGAPADGWGPGSTAGLAAAVLCVSGLGLVWTAASEGARTQESADWPIRVVTYNVYCGVGPDSRFDLDAIARTLEAESPDVIVLQEVSRGWMVNGNVDLVGWLADRLGMGYVFHGTADPTWGNAVMTRLPMRQVRRWELPPRSLLLRRGVLDVEIEVADDDRLRILGTHLHHPRQGGPERIVQSKRLTEIWDGSKRTLIAGDLNALPEESEIRHLHDAGLRDALDLAGVGQGFTYPSWEPVRRIDYVFLSPDLTTIDARVSPSTASDHAAVISVVQPAE